MRRRNAICRSVRVGQVRHQPRNAGLASLLGSVTVLAVLFCACIAGVAPVKLIFDTDVGNDIDDVLAISVIHVLQSRGECELLGVTITKPKARTCGNRSKRTRRAFGATAIFSRASRPMRQPSSCLPIAENPGEF